MLPTTTKGSEVVERAPDSEAIKKCFEFPESAEYLLVRLIEKLKSVELLDKAEELIQKVQEYVDIVLKQRSLQGDHWAASPACGRSTFLNLQSQLAAEARDKLTQVITDPMKMDFAVGEAAQFLRGYSVNGKGLDPELLDACDKLFNAWLAENNLLSKDGQIYEITDTGDIRKDENGELMLADSSKIKALLEDPAKGFQAYLADSKKTIQLLTQAHPFPKEAQPAQPEAAKTAAEAPVSEPAPKMPAENEAPRPEDSSNTGIRG